MERLFISLSHLQHSDTVAVKDSRPEPQADTGSGRNDIKQQGVKRATTKQPFHHLRAPLNKLRQFHTNIRLRVTLPRPAGSGCYWKHAKRW